MKGWVCIKLNAAPGPVPCIGLNNRITEAEATVVQKFNQGTSGNQGVIDCRAHPERSRRIEGLGKQKSNIKNNLIDGMKSKIKNPLP